MGYTFRTLVPASDLLDPIAVPISVSGDTQLKFQGGSFEVAYEQNGFNTGQFFYQDGATAPQLLKFSNTGKTILWIRNPPADAGLENYLFVWTDIGSVNL